MVPYRISLLRKDHVFGREVPCFGLSLLLPRTCPVPLKAWVDGLALNTGSMLLRKGPEDLGPLPRLGFEIHPSNDINPLKKTGRFDRAEGGRRKL